MNGAQRAVVMLGLLAMSAVSLYPPWMRSWEAYEVRQSPFRKTSGPDDMVVDAAPGADLLGHHFLFEPPPFEGSRAAGRGGVHVDYGLLAVYWAAFGSATAALAVVVGGKRTTHIGPDAEEEESDGNEA